MQPELPRHPKPSTADYRPKTVAPLIEFFRPIVSNVLGTSVTLCQMTFEYENNTPSDPEDDIFVQHPTCNSEQYIPKTIPTFKSKEQLRYEAAAKKSKRLYDFMIQSPARIRYFDEDSNHEYIPY